LGPRIAAAIEISAAGQQSFERVDVWEIVGNAVECSHADLT
jgi:hypothetical protein